MKRIKRSPLSFLWKGSGFFFTLLLLLAFVKGNDLEKVGLKGKVKKCSTTDYRVLGVPPHLTLQRTDWDDLEFDENGTKKGEKIPQYPDSINHHFYKDRKWIMKTIDSLMKCPYYIKVPNPYREWEDGPYYYGETYFIYDHKGRKREMISLSTGGFKRVIKYNTNGEVKYYYSNENGLTIDESKTFWSKNGDTRTYRYINNVLLEKTIQKYTYDTVKNWITDSIFENDTLSYIKKREIVYW